MTDQLPGINKKYYLAGRMTGVLGYNFPNFERACELLRVGRKLTIASPHEIDHGETPETRGSLPYGVYARAALKLLLECDGIILLPRWEGSVGAELEFRVALTLGMEIFQIMTLEHKWWESEDYHPIMQIDGKSVGLLNIPLTMDY